MPAREDEPSLSEVLLVLADAELMWPARRLGFTTDRLAEYLREQAEKLSPGGRPVPVAPAARSVPAQPERSEPASVVEGRATRPSAPAARSAPAHPERGESARVVEGRATRPSAPPQPSEPAIAVGEHAVLEVFSDGAARGNPGPAGAGAVVRTIDGKVIARVGKFLGTQTNNVAEYEGLLIGVQKALDLGAKEVRIFADSLLVISQLKGEWKIKHPGLRPYYDRAKLLLKRFDKTTLQHVRRELNSQADEMSNRAIDERM